MDNWPQTLEEIGTGLGVTRERIRQIKLEAEEKMKKAAARLHISLSDLIVED